MYFCKLLYIISLQIIQNNHSDHHTQLEVPIWSRLYIYQILSRLPIQHFISFSPWKNPNPIQTLRSHHLYIDEGGLLQRKWLSELVCPTTLFLWKHLKGSGKSITYAYVGLYHSDDNNGHDRWPWWTMLMLKSQFNEGK